VINMLLSLISSLGYGCVAFGAAKRCIVGLALLELGLV